MNFNVTHIPKEGFKYTHNNKSLIVHGLVITKETNEFNVESFQSSFLTFHQSIKGEKPITGTDRILLTRQDFNTPEIHDMYKYVSTAVLKSRILKGWFRFGTIDYYKSAENERIRDEFEGFTGLDIQTGKRHVITSATSGFNYHIYCGTDFKKSNKSNMKKQFGESLIRIKDVKSFAEAIKKAVGAKAFQIQKIMYSTLKLYQLRDDAIDVESIKNDGHFSFIQTCLFI